MVLDSANQLWLLFTDFTELVKQARKSASHASTEAECWETMVFDCSFQPVPYSYLEACPRFQSPLFQWVASPYTSVQSLDHTATASTSSPYTDPTDILHSESTAGPREESLYIHLDKYFFDFILVSLQAASWKYMLQFTKWGASTQHKFLEHKITAQLVFCKALKQNGDRGTTDYRTIILQAQLSWVHCQGFYQGWNGASVLWISSIHFASTSTNTNVHRPTYMHSKI